MLSVEQILNSYYENGAQKLHNVVNQIFYRKYGGIANKDMDEFYSVANDVFSDIILNDRYDESKGDFDGFLYGALDFAIIDEFKRQHRDKRTTKIVIEVENDKGEIEKKKVSVSDIYMDTPIGDENGLTIGDTLKSDFDMETVLSEKYNNIYSDKMKKFLDNLPKTQRQIAEMISRGINTSDIKQKLELSESQYNQNFKALTGFKNVKILKDSNDDIAFKEDDLEMSTTTQTMENCKTDKISIASVIKKIDKNTIRFNHPLQRESDQWSPSMKGNLISDILQGNRLHPLIFAEQIINGVPIIWDLDGKQRCTNAYSFANNGYKVSKNIRRWMIKYQTTKKDENGNEVLDDNGFPIAQNEEFDIRGKRFSDLPEELQEKFLDYTFNYDQYLNCSEEDIGYHIERYNDGKNMNTAQKGTVKLGTEYAEMVKSISAMPFFRDMGGYKVSEFKNGTINRVVVESIMAANYLEDWKKKQEEMCEYIKKNASTTEFDNFEDMVERLEKVATDDVASMFDSKDSFLYFGLFSRFINTGLDDKKFIEFLAEFSRSLHSKEVNGITYDELCIDKETGKTRSTKDKYIVVPKMELLEKLMKEYLHIEENDNKEMNTETFISENVGLSLEEVSKDIECYEETLDELEDRTIKVGSKLLEEANRLSLLAMVAYSFKNDVDLDYWIEEYAKNNNTYLADQKKNFCHMVESFNSYNSKVGVA